MSERVFIPVQVAVVTVSDTRTAETDRSGQTIVDLLTAAGHVVVRREIVRDNREQIREALRGHIADREVDVIITTGGT